MSLQRGQVVITAAGKDLSGQIIQAFVGSPWTHAFIVTGQDEIIESLPLIGVRTYSLNKRMEELVTEKRRYFVMDILDLGKLERLAVAAIARSYLGRGYNYISGLLWLLLGYFFYDSKKRMICSRVITLAYEEAFKLKLFDYKITDLDAIHQSDLRKGYATPVDLLRYSILAIDSKG